MPELTYLLTIDPVSGEELHRVELPDLGGPGLEDPIALAARGSELWLLESGDSTGIAASRRDPATGIVLESVPIPGPIWASDADFAPDGTLWISFEDLFPIPVGGCTRFWRVPALGEPAEEQEDVDHCWGAGYPQVPILGNFVIVGPAPTVVEVPTLAPVPTAILAALLTAAGLHALRRRGG